MKTAVVVLSAFLFSVVPCFAQNWTGDGGRGKSIAIVAPKATGLPDSLNYLPVLVQGELVSNFTMFSAISVLDRHNYEEQMLALMEEIYSDRAREGLSLGNLPHTDYFMDGTITRTRTGYNLQVRVLRTSDQTTVATHSATSTFDELDNLTSVRRASLELLQRMGITLTSQAQTTLGGAATSSHVNAQTALAQGIVAQRQGTEVAALSYFYQAAAFDPSLAEALGRSQVMSANISSANIGENIRNDIVWRREWVARLQETEEVFHRMISSADPPYSLFYSTQIETENINYQTETADLQIQINLNADAKWFSAMRNALQVAQTVQSGLDATNRKNDWQLGDWPSQGVSNTNPFNRQWQHNISVDFELVNQSGRAIGRQSVQLRPHFTISRSNEIFVIEITGNTASILTFNGVKADAISNNLTIRIANVNGRPAETARFKIVAFTPGQIGSFTDPRDNKTYRTVVMPDGQTWMAQNLDFATTSGSWCYYDDPRECAIYGRLYDWNTAMIVCPAGWHLPSDDDWTTLEIVVGGSSTAVRKLKAQSGWDRNGNGTDDFGFSALPGGYRNTDDSISNAGDDIGLWWTATEGSADGARGREMGYDNGGVFSHWYSKVVGFSVRCVRD